MISVATLLVLCVLLLAGSAGMAVLVLAFWRDASRRLRRITSERRMIQRENDIAGTVNALTQVMRSHQVVLDKLHTAHGATHGVVMHQLRQAHMDRERAAAERPERVIMIGMFGQMPRTDA